MDLPAYVAPSKAGASVRVFMQPRAARDAIVGEHGDALRLKVEAPPLEGRAGRAVQELLSRVLDVPPSSVVVSAGHGSRHKRVEVAGTSAGKVARTLQLVLSSRAHGSGEEVDRP